MENKINKVITTGDGKKFIIMKQAIYHDENYFAAARVNNEETEVSDDFHLLHEFVKDGQIYIETVTDANLAKLLLDNFDNE